MCCRLATQQHTQQSTPPQAADCMLSSNADHYPSCMSAQMSIQMSTHRACLICFVVDRNAR